MKTRLAQLGLVAVMVLIGVYLFISGKEHKVFIENKTAGEYKAVKVAYYTVNDQEEEKIKKRKKKLAKVKGKSHEITVVYKDGDKEQKVTKEFTLGAMDEATISIPSLLGGSAQWIEVESTRKKDGL